MPGRDGTGPFGKGPITGKNGYKGRKGGVGAGPEGYCVCPNCGEKVKHTIGTPCTSIKCPKCGTSLIRG